MEAVIALVSATDLDHMALSAAARPWPLLTLLQLTAHPAAASAVAPALVDTLLPMLDKAGLAAVGQARLFVGPAVRCQLPPSSVAATMHLNVNFRSAVSAVELAALLVWCPTPPSDTTVGRERVLTSLVQRWRPSADGLVSTGGRLLELARTPSIMTALLEVRSRANAPRQSTSSPLRPTGWCVTECR